MQAPINWTTAAALILALIGTSAARADVQGIERAWIDLGDNGGTLHSVTIGGQVLADLTFPSSGTVQLSASPTNPDRTFWNDGGGANPTTAMAALSGEIATDGLLNSAVTFQFGQTLSTTDLLVFFDAEGGGLSESVQFFPVDGSGTKIGNYSLTLHEANGKSSAYGANLITGGYELAAEDVANPLTGFNIRGVSFTLADMAGDTGNLALAQGFSVEDPFGNLDVDPALAAIAAFMPPDANFNGDAQINGADLTILASNYGNFGVGQAGGDANLDGTVDYRDYLIWRQSALGDPIELSAALAAAEVPEPAVVWLVAAAAIAVTFDPRRTRHEV